MLALNDGLFYEQLDYNDAIRYAVLDLKHYGQDYLKDYLQH